MVPTLRDREPARGGHDGEARHVRRAALIRGHAERGVALHVLDGDEPFAVGEAKIVGRYVMLEIDEGLAWAPLISKIGAGDTSRSGASTWGGSSRGGVRLAAAELAAMPSTMASRVGERTGECARAMPALCRWGRQECWRPASHCGVAPAWLASVNGGRPAARHDETVDVDWCASRRCVLALPAFEGLDGDLADRGASLGGDHRMSGQKLGAGPFRRAPGPRRTLDCGRRRWRRCRRRPSPAPRLPGRRCHCW